MTAIEEQEIKGVTGKLLWAMVISTSTITASIVGFYFGLSAQIAAINSENLRKWDVRQEQYITEKEKLENAIVVLTDHEKRIMKVESKQNN